MAIAVEGTDAADRAVGAAETDQSGGSRGGWWKTAAAWLALYLIVMLAERLWG